MTKKSEEFNDRETATVGVCMQLIDVMRRRHRAGIMDAADEGARYLESNYGILQRIAAPKSLKKWRKQHG